jgi:hypothetical protein
LVGKVDKERVGWEGGEGDEKNSGMKTYMFEEM